MKTNEGQKEHGLLKLRSFPNPVVGAATAQNAGKNTNNGVGIRSLVFIAIRKIMHLLSVQDGCPNIIQ